MAYAIQVLPRVRRQLRRLPQDVLERVGTAIGKLAETPRPIQCVKLRGRSEQLRVRVGGYRVLYQVDDDAQLVTILAVRHRSAAYER